ncbi:glycosylphosphatidylinositol synthesis N-acetylglucosaminyltransferase complex, subunit PIG-Q/GPI1 [Scheffersomyces stipitis CBS 6054]|uniref:Glycosylphosphatidylinositol synthesis N-acetylglucosaminyltransferase complex, subunit PIG-Q/GPI1 n=1 Tax=Scheffersomyces stipitis (strain ATCC 58785 / CBS 6054 / NBRC 10063 / NRRL Y-11545) TaxID=322104 RepID=A3LRY9_PICST|nr:glycosylphosphatidylinositol synthesis N-acetylglucosaminyltransferase complex, subunit PIG-Q/GPI1 [Scheffersomyces stipitis CBS 6054]ABN65469.1 glycosylphosphatidylinositol synthesis N-acetylglucosaminyltransferase complex, subunit PIG-Q/GPI1 [Scheffersomyces stipitis CBS 6054]
MTCSSELQIYFPHDLIRTVSRSNVTKKWYLVGFNINNIYIVVQVVQRKYLNLKKLPPALKGLVIIGSINDEANKYDLSLVWSENTKLPIIKNRPDPAFIIIFQPPNFKNLEYFSINPILLQSMGNDLVNFASNELSEKFCSVEPKTITSKNQSFISDDKILQRINRIVQYRIELRNWLGESHIVNFDPSSYSFLLGILRTVIRSLQMLIIWLIWIINLNTFGFSLVSISKVFRQLDLRLKQLNYFPVQFLFYYDRSILLGDLEESNLVKELQLPIFNSSLNINNSNYINLYNSIWLIFNDILYGTTLYRIIILNFDKIIKFLHTTVIEGFLFNNLMETIAWVSIKHPAGFKLNNELGQFLGDLYTWILRFWKFFVNDFAQQNLVPMLRGDIVYSLKNLLFILCYLGGISFLLGFIIDIVNLFTLHIYFFYYISTKIYRRQLQVINSLFQLFRGKKYNVLRDRIDNLNNYEDNNDFEIDRLLLGTLFFMVLILLLPTIFAFYLLFFLMWLSLLMTLNLLENLQILVSFTPLFVILLKMKNSKRLQGGINFSYIGSSGATSYISMSNKSLSYNEIFTNYIKLFRNAKNFRESIVQHFFSGKVISIKYNNDLKFHYLMLPKNHDKTINIWKYVR